MCTKNFKCGDCGGNTIEEIITGATVTTPVLTVFEVLPDGGCCCDYNYALENAEGGDVSHYQCSSCGHVLSEDELEALEEDCENQEEYLSYLTLNP